LAPAAANTMDAARPMPPPAPVTIRLLPWRSPVIADYSARLGLVRAIRCGEDGLRTAETIRVANRDGQITCRNAGNILGE
jgi:hypothetical protein